MSDQHVHLEFVPLHGESFTIAYADDLAEFFFRANASASGEGSYDEWTLSAHDPNRITAGDITAVNRTMAARTAPKRWTSFTESVEDAGWLSALDLGWDLFAMPEGEWLRHGVQTRLGDAFKAVMGPYRGAAVATKVLHIKRPRLIPVCDSYVARTMCVQLWDSADWHSLLALVVHLRKQGRANAEGLRVIRERLRAAGFERTAVRILDALLWMHAGDSGPYAAFSAWLALQEERDRPTRP